MVQLWNPVHKHVFSGNKLAWLNSTNLHLCFHSDVLIHHGTSVGENKNGCLILLDPC